MQDAIEHPLLDGATSARVHLVGIANFAPLQEQLVERALGQLQPQVCCHCMPAWLLCGLLQYVAHAPCNDDGDAAPSSSVCHCQLMSPAKMRSFTCRVC